MENQEAKDRILNSALKEFSDKGFAGARMDAIARRAKVNKALIYYYFKSKDALYKELVDGFMVDTKEKAIQIISNRNSRNEEDVQEMFLNFFQYLEKHESLIRLILMDSLKKGSSENLFSFIELLYGDKNELDKLAASMQMSSDHSEDMDKLKVSEFFTLLGPVLFFIVLREDWTKYFDTTKEAMTANFISILQETHLGHHH